MKVDCIFECVICVNVRDCSALFRLYSYFSCNAFASIYFSVFSVYIQFSLARSFQSYTLDVCAFRNQKNQIYLFRSFDFYK